MSKNKLKLLSKTHQFQITAGEIEHMRQKAVIDAVRITHYFPLFILKDKFKFGEKRLHRFQEDYVAMWDKYNNQDIDLDQMKQVLLDKSGLIIEESKDTHQPYPDSEFGKKVTVSKKELDTIKKHAVNDAFSVTSHVPLYVLLSEWSFGKVRLERFYSDYMTLWEDYKNNLIDLNDIAQVLKDENNITWDEQ